MRWLPILLLLCAGCSSSLSSPPNVAAVPLTNDQRAAVEQGVRKGLKDPESARFGDMFATRDAQGVVTVCGYVNAKNSFGGYGGMKPFVGVLGPVGSFGLAGVGGSDGDTYGVVTACKRAGINLA